MSAVRVLLVEDSEDDAALVERQLRKAGYAPEITRVEDEPSMRAALALGGWDLIVSDWTVPGFGALDALRIHRELGQDAPFLVVSGTIGEERAVEAMRTGARDVILKDGLIRLAPAVERELCEARLRAEQRAMREELRASQETLARSAKLRALGQMAAGISHDLKNILNPISLHLQLLKRAVTRGAADEARESIAEMDQILKRGVQTIERLREFSRQSPESRAEIVDINQLAHEATEIARSRMASRPSLSLTLREEHGRPPPVMARSGELVSAVVNLVVNAIDALSQPLSTGTGTGEHAPGLITLRTGESRGGAWIEVADNGPGMVPEVEQHVFDPFFTTKGQEGTGLGLAMVYACVQRHGGTVSLVTAPGRGARFTLWFPGISPAKPDDLR
ncbi:MAG TPA: ATP-binding protein [Candidatus Nanopelagicales bacterium]|nr:ATP-binding protein [Candidatus Nanopelagicales bacterium]